MPRALINLAAGIPGKRYNVFVSSGADASPVRDRIRGLIQEVFNPALEDSEQGFYLYADMWERTAAQRAAGESINDVFVARARKSHITLVTLIDQLGDGTREELEAVLNEEDVQLAVMRFTEQTTDAAATDALGRYLTKHQQNFLYALHPGGPHSDDAWYTVVRQLLAVVLSALAETEPPYTETRGLP
jgi:cellobiose phosphorylase